jgi:hypothetical protein
MNHHTRILLAAVLAVFCHTAAAQVPQIINYQGRINVGASPFTGTGQFRFALVNGDSSTSFWSNDGTSTAGSQPTAAVSLPVANGLYVVPLGDTSIANMQAVPASVFTNNDVRLRVWFNDGTNGSQLLSPDQRITSVGYAMVAGTVPDGAITSAKIAPGAVNSAQLANGINVTGNLNGNATTATNATNLAIQLGSSGSINGPGNPVSWSQLKHVPAVFADGSDDMGVTSITAGSGLAGGTITSMGTIALSNTGVSAGIYGSPNSIPRISVDAQGRITNASSNALSIGPGEIQSGAVNSSHLSPNTVLSSYISPGAVSRPTTTSATSVNAVANTDYLLTSATQTTVTLPASPSIGDVIRISSSGAGGWKIAQNSGQSIMGATQLVNGGSFGATWTQTLFTGSNSQGVACSSDGSRVCVVALGANNYTSADYGVTWTARGGGLSCVASSASGSKLAAAASTGGFLYTSTDYGVNWISRPLSGTIRSIASSSDGSKLVAVIQNGQIYTSTDSGASWTARESSRAWYGVASSADGTKLVAVVNGGQIYTSTDSGVNWTARDSSRSWYAVASSSDGAKLVAVVQGGQIYTSTDSGATWTARESSRNWYSVASSADGTILTAGVSGGGSGQLYASTDGGVTWVARDSSRQWNGVAMSADGTKQFASAAGVGGFVSSSNSTYGSSTGAAGYLTGGQYSAIELLYIGNNQFMLRSHEGTILAY